MDSFETVLNLCKELHDNVHKVCNNEEDSDFAFAIIQMYFAGAQQAGRDVRKRLNENRN